MRQRFNFLLCLSYEISCINDSSTPEISSSILRIDANDVLAQTELCIVADAFSQVDANDVPEFLVSTATQTPAQLNIEQEPHQNFYNMIFDLVKLGRPT
jgi:hypothetical protein